MSDDLNKTFRGSSRDRSNSESGTNSTKKPSSKNTKKQLTQNKIDFGEGSKSLRSRIVPIRTEPGKSEETKEILNSSDEQFLGFENEPNLVEAEIGGWSNLLAWQ